MKNSLGEKKVVSRIVSLFDQVGETRREFIGISCWHASIYRRSRESESDLRNLTFVKVGGWILESSDSKVEKIMFSISNTQTDRIGKFRLWEILNNEMIRSFEIFNF